MKNISEFELIDIIKRGVWKDNSVSIGIGDDAAVVRYSGDLVVTTDCLAESVHFIKDKAPPGFLARKALVSNISDLIVMGAVPRYMLLNLNIAKDYDMRYILNFIKKLKSDLRRWRISLIGGNISGLSNGFVINITLLGSPGKATITRTGAQPGDSIFVLKPLGASALAVDGMLGRIKVSSSFEKALLKSHFAPHLFQKEFFYLSDIITSAIDISDGLLQDLSHICKSSKVGAELILESVPVHRTVKKSLKHIGLSDIGVAIYAITSGEEYVPLFTAVRDAVNSKRAEFIQKFRRQIYEIGTIIRGRKIKLLYKGIEISKPIEGYDHLRQR